MLKAGTRGDWSQVQLVREQGEREIERLRHKVEELEATIEATAHLAVGPLLTAIHVLSGTFMVRRSKRYRLVHNAKSPAR